MWHRIRLSHRPDLGKQVLDIGRELLEMAGNVVGPDAPDVGMFAYYDEDYNPTIYLTPELARVVPLAKQKYQAEPCEAPPNDDRLDFLGGDPRTWDLLDDSGER